MTCLPPLWGTLLNTDSLPLSQAARCFPRRTETHSQRTHRRTGRFKGSRPSGNSQLCLVFVFTLCFVTTQLQLPCLQGFPPCLYVCFCQRAGRVSFASALVNFLHLPLSLSLNPKSAHVSACSSREQRAHGQRTGQAAGTRPTQHQAQARQQPAQTQDPWRQPWTMACGLAGCPPASTAGGCGAGSRGGGGRRASREPAATSPCAVDRGSAVLWFEQEEKRDLAWSELSSMGYDVREVASRAAEEPAGRPAERQAPRAAEPCPHCQILLRALQNMYSASYSCAAALRFLSFVESAVFALCPLSVLMLRRARQLAAAGYAVLPGRASRPPQNNRFWKGLPVTCHCCVFSETHCAFCAAIFCWTVFFESAPLAAFHQLLASMAGRSLSGPGRTHVCCGWCRHRRSALFSRSLFETALASRTRSHSSWLRGCRSWATLSVEFCLKLDLTGHPSKGTPAETHTGEPQNFSVAACLRVTWQDVLPQFLAQSTS